MSASDVAPEVAILSSALLNINKYTSASENVHLGLRTFNWVTLVSLLVEYLLYSVVVRNNGLDILLVTSVYPIYMLE